VILLFLCVCVSLSLWQYVVQVSAARACACVSSDVLIKLIRLNLQGTCIISSFDERARTRIETQKLPSKNNRGKKRNAHVLRTNKVKSVLIITSFSSLASLLQQEQTSCMYAAQLYACCSSIQYSCPLFLNRLDAFPATAQLLLPQANAVVASADSQHVAGHAPAATPYDDLEFQHLALPVGCICLIGACSACPDSYGVVLRGRGNVGFAERRRRPRDIAHPVSVSRKSADVVVRSGSRVVRPELDEVV
jgi:hypothetical protein